LQGVDGIKNHERFLALLSAGLPIPADLVAWYRAAVRQHEDEGKPLCTCLGIRGAGIRSAKNRALLRRRDVLLLWATNCCWSFPGSCLWDRCGILADLIRRYPRSKKEHPLLEHIFALGINVPTSQNGIYERVEALEQIPRYSASRKKR
jgi:hypothetical protein